MRFQEALARGNLAEEVLKEIPAQFCRYMEMIEYVPMKIDPDLQLINRTVKKQREAMLAKRMRQQSDVNGVENPAAISYQVNNDEKKVAEGGPKIFGASEKQVGDKKKRRNRDKDQGEQSREREVRSHGQEGKRRRKSRD